MDDLVVGRWSLVKSREIEVSDVVDDADDGDDDENA